MRIRVNRLVYVLIAAALAVGLLMTAFMRPGRTLTASENCYGPCPSVTVLSLSRARVVYGHEQVEKFSVKVSARTPGTGVPKGYVVVESGPKILCTIHLFHGKGSCSPTRKALRPGSHKIVAHYFGSTKFKPSTSKRKTLIVLRH